MSCNVRKIVAAIRSNITKEQDMENNACYQRDIPPRFIEARHRYLDWLPQHLRQLS